MPRAILWAILLTSVALAHPVSAKMCQKPDGTFTDQCNQADRAVEIRPGAVQTPTGTGTAAKPKAGGVGPWCREFLGLDPRTRLSALLMGSGFDGVNLSPPCVEDELIPRLLEGCRAGYLDQIVQKRALASAKKQCRPARW